MDITLAIGDGCMLPGYGHRYHEYPHGKISGISCVHIVYTYILYLYVKFSGPQIYLMYIRTLKSLGEGSHMHPQNLHVKITRP